MRLANLKSGKVLGGSVMGIGFCESAIRVSRVDLLRVNLERALVSIGDRVVLVDMVGIIVEIVEILAVVDVVPDVTGT